MKLSIPIALTLMMTAACQRLGADDYRATLSGHGFAPVNGTRLYYQGARPAPRVDPRWQSG